VSKLGAFMSDIFDEVDEILADVDVNADDSVIAEADSNFNESELQDIMAEIESLEKEFEGESVETMEATAEPIVVPVKKTALQEEIEREIEMSMEVSDEKKVDMVMDIADEPIVTPVAPVQEPKVLAFEKKSTPSVSGSEISFEATGSMTLNLGFKVGNESAKLTIDPVKGLLVTMNGVELCISSEEGCKVTMENGVKFTIPLTSAESTSKKKTA
jgi:hypothetical protein